MKAVYNRGRAFQAFFGDTAPLIPKNKLLDKIPGGPKVSQSDPGPGHPYNKHTRI